MTQDDYVVMKKSSREKLIKELKEVKKENQQLQKQKDDVVNALRKLKHRILYEEDFCSEDDCIDEILRMLGEIE